MRYTLQEREEQKKRKLIVRIIAVRGEKQRERDENGDEG